MREIRHIIWDWNGTLLDDGNLTVRAAQAALAAVGHPMELTRPIWRQVATRPLEITYEKLAGTTLTASQWQTINTVWLETYLAGFGEVALNPLARPALAEAAAHGLTQSIVSLHFEKELLHDVAALGVDGYFTSVTGSHGGGIGVSLSKADIVQNQLAELGIEPQQALMIGDMKDDGDEATKAGVPAILVSTGDTSRERLVASGYPIADSLLDAVQMTSLI